MRKLNHAALIAAIAAALSAAPTYGQTGTANVWSGSIPPARADDRASAVIRVIDADKRTGEPQAIDTAELARARAAGEIQVTEGTSAQVLERLRSRPAGQAALVDAAGDARANAQATARFDDVARSREHAKYEAEKKRRAVEVAPRASVQASADPRSGGQPRAGIAWSATEQPSARAVEIETRAGASVSVEPTAPAEAAAELR